MFSPCHGSLIIDKIITLLVIIKLFFAFNIFFYFTLCKMQTNGKSKFMNSLNKNIITMRCYY